MERWWLSIEEVQLMRASGGSLMLHEYCEGKTEAERGCLHLINKQESGFERCLHFLPKTLKRVKYK